MSVIDDLLAKRPEERTVFMPLDFELARRAAQLEEELHRARLRNDTPGSGPEEATVLEEAEQAFDAAVEALKGATVKFTFRSISSELFDELRRTHRPTETQRSEAKKVGMNPPEWNEATFSPALIAAACIAVSGPNGTQDGLSVEEAERLWQAENWNKAERGELFNQALSAYVSRTRMVEFPKAPV